MWEVIYTDEAEQEKQAVRPRKFQDSLHNSLLIAGRLDDPRRHCDVKPMDSNGGLKAKLDGFYRLRHGDHRMVFRLLHRETHANPWRWIHEGDTVSHRGQKYLQVVRLAHRDHVYNYELKQRTFYIYREDVDNLDVIIGRLTT